jgi:hypothetical protein
MKQELLVEQQRQNNPASALQQVFHPQSASDEIMPTLAKPREYFVTPANYCVQQEAEKVYISNRQKDRLRTLQDRFKMRG